MYTWWHVGRWRARVHLVARWVMEGVCALGGTLGGGGRVGTLRNKENKKKRSLYVRVFVSKRLSMVTDQPSTSSRQSLLGICCTCLFVAVSSVCDEIFMFFGTVLL